MILTDDYLDPVLDLMMIELSTPNKQLHYDFIMMMKLHGFSQLIQSPTHIHGNTLDLICSNRPELIYEHDVVSLSLSDHSIITAAIEMESTRPGATTRVI